MKVVLFCALVGALMYSWLPSSSSRISTVMAQSAVSEESLSSTYAVMFFNDQESGSIGTIEFDGRGKIAGGSVTRGGGTHPCKYALSGTYHLEANGSGSAQLKLDPQGNDQCGTPYEVPMTLAATDQGRSLMIYSHTGKSPVYGWASKR